jgi:hypothetical protein
MHAFPEILFVALALALLPSCSSGGAPAGASDASPGRDAALPPEASPRDGTPDAPRDTDPDRHAGDDSAPDAPATTCSDGSPVAYLRTNCPGTPAAVPSALASSLEAATRGDVVSLDGADEDGSPCFPVRVCVPADAATLLFSDEPESPSSDGVLYADVLGPGHVRAYVYHVNAGTGLRKFPVVLLNQGTSTVHAVVGPVGIAGPSSDYVSVGKQAVSAWMQSSGTSTVEVPPGERVLLDSDLDGVHAASGELAHGILDFTLDGTVKISVVSVVADEDAASVTAGLSLLPNTGMHLRGTFPGANLVLENTIPLDGLGLRHIGLGGGTTDATLSGHDDVDGTSVSLLGDYGVPYALRLHTAATTALAVAPQGGEWGGVAQIPSGLDGAASITMLPTASDSLGSQTQAVFLGRFAASEDVEGLLMTAGGSNLPVDIAAIPVP